MSCPKVRLDSICQIVSGSTPKTNCQDYWVGENKWVTPAEIQDDTRIIYDTKRHISDLAVTKTGLKLLPIGTVLLSSRAPIGKLAITGAEMYCNQGFKNLICSDNIYNKYLYYNLLYLKPEIIALGRGATFKEISKETVSGIKISLRDLSEQYRIALILDIITHLIDCSKYINSFLSDIVVSRFIEMFGDPVSNELGWDELPLSSYSTKITDGEHGSIARVTDGKVYITAKNIINGKIDIANASYISEEDSSQIILRCKPEYEDILMTTTGTIGKVIINPLKVPFAMDRGITLIKYCRDLLDPYFLKCLLEIDSMQANLLTRTKQATIAHLFLKEVKAIKIIEVPFDLQKEFSEVYKQVDKSKVDVESMPNKLIKYTLYKELEGLNVLDTESICRSV